LGCTGFGGRPGMMEDGFAFKSKDAVGTAVLFDLVFFF
jgi:hypothetical protein